MTIINGVSDFIKGKVESFENYLKNFADAQNFRDSYYKNFAEERLLTKKTHRVGEGKQNNF